MARSKHTVSQIRQGMAFSINSRYEQIDGNVTPAFKRGYNTGTNYAGKCDILVFGLAMIIPLLLILLTLFNKKMKITYISLASITKRMVLNQLTMVQMLRITQHWFKPREANYQSNEGTDTSQPCPGTDNTPLPQLRRFKSLHHSTSQRTTYITRLLSK